MNILVVGGSAALLVLGMASVLLPAPWPWAMPVLITASWIWTVFSRPQPKTQTAEIPAAPPPPVTVLPPRIEVREVTPPGLVEDLHRFRATQEILLGLKALVVGETETATLQVTKALFLLVENSKQVSSHIEKSLAFITQGDEGLGKTIANLEGQVKVFETLTNHFTHLKEGLASDIGVLTQAVRNINQFSETLSDLADQTNVLAINASIEAARVGIHGRGFAVIATQVQTLAKNSKSIAEKMAQTVREVVANVESSFARQTQRIHDSEGLIVRSEKELRQWANQASPQLSEMEVMIDDSRRLAGVLTGQLGEVTVSLQFQDRTKQVLDHLADIFTENLARVVDSSGLAHHPIPSQVRDEAFQTASRHFTVKEEWAVGPSGRHEGQPTLKPVELF